MAESYKYIYGPVPSRRLGLSLGIDIIPFKICTLDCIYCQLGHTPDKTLERKEYVPVEPILTELKNKLDQGLKADFITLGGSGEPTLNTSFGRLIDAIKALTSIPVAVLTNGTLLTDKFIRGDCARADVVMPSLDAADEQTFQKINRPHQDLTIENIISGLVGFRKQYTGQIWLEVFLIETVNTAPEHIEKIKNAIERIRPDKVQLNTAVRPTAEPSLKCVSPQKLHDIADRLGPNCEVIVDFSKHKTAEDSTTDITSALDPHTMETLLSMLKRRPCSVNDISSAMDIPPNEALKYIAHLKHNNLIDFEHTPGKAFFRVK
ncbi:radical SAM protein [Planctomycetota bacterium]